MLSDLVGNADEAPVPQRSPSMPSTLCRRDMTAQSRARIPSSVMPAMQSRGLRRVKSSPSTSQGGNADLTYFSYEDRQEWRMPARKMYKEPRSNRPLDGIGGRVIPGTSPNKQLFVAPSLSWG
ncbi:unnamed protein product [Polarella glacialis]|uniref:Uncharacterized protein n=1 Tax=Polarella glacialis TaxID=89957 RepID=A0A813L8Y1_POLGL|nr:unnamed protein product [Polarella glacialis]